MDWTRFFSYLLGFFGIILPLVDMSGKENWESKIYQTYVVEDFETINLTSDHFRVRKYKEDPLPEVWMTSNITAPIPGSRRALLFRFSEDTNYPAEFIFPEPIEFSEFLKEMEFPIYSSKSGGSVSIILQTHDYENKKIFLSNLNFRGWRNVKLTIRERLNQNDPVLNSKLVIRFIGFIYEPQSSTPYGSEILVGFDDISVTTRKKYRLLPDPASLLE
ncbi:flagellar assembly protein FlaA [Leptospira sp. GIMC2001]|uniref:flagellar assembly protein FlaA n=1 Tax=Leptospira sp. GIMC2001 TaxID=1513297 RepID=UPI0023498C7C|nr:flagellar assembly protein FlaA [Leptospira sp. GIMC2001]WCL50423.1 flagellar assembly protein FlaA [Leptospira sp. GIMC2001]